MKISGVEDCKSIKHDQLRNSKKAHDWKQSLLHQYKTYKIQNAFKN